MTFPMSITELCVGSVIDIHLIIVDPRDENPRKYIHS